MEKLVIELKKALPFKETTTTGDVVVIAAKEPQMLVYAVVGEITRDATRKEEWWHVTLHILTMPPQTVVWTLRTPQFTGQEIFTMGGEGRFVKAIALGQEPPVQPPAPKPVAPAGGGQEKKVALRVVK